MPDFNNKPDVTGAANLDNIGAWVTLASNPVSFNEKLAQFKAAQEAALGAQAIANEKIALVGKAEEITALLAQAKKTNAAAQDALADAAKKAQNIVDDATERAAQIIADANSNKKIAENTLLDAAKLADERTALLDSRQLGIDEQYAQAQRKADTADAAKEQYEKLAKTALEHKDLAIARIDLINEQFAKFLSAIK